MSPFTVKKAIATIPIELNFIARIRCLLLNLQCDKKDHHNKVKKDSCTWHLISSGKRSMFGVDCRSISLSSRKTERQTAVILLILSTPVHSTENLRPAVTS